MEDVDSTDAMEELNKVKPNEKKTDSLPAKKQGFSDNKPNAILPDKQNKKQEN